MSFVKLVFSYLALLSICGAASAADPDDLIQWNEPEGFEPNPVAYMLWDKLDYAAGNSNHGLGYFNPHKFDKRKFLEAMKVSNTNGVDCIDRRITTSRKKTLGYFREMVGEWRPFDNAGDKVTPELRTKHKRWVERLLGYEQVAFIVYNGYKFGSKEDNSEGCGYFHIYAFFKDRTVLKLVFDFTD